MSTNPRTAAVATILAVLGLAAVAAAATPEQKCAATVVKESGKYVKARTKVLAKCNDALLKAKDGFNDVQGEGCRSLDGKTQEKLDKATSKLEAALDKACGGSTKSCQDGDALDLDDPAIGWGPSGGFAGQCPGFEDELACQFAIDDCGGVGSSGQGVSDCLRCIDDEAVDQAIDLLYAGLDPANFGAAVEPGKTRNKCQQELVKSSAKFLLAKSKIRAKCWAALDQGKDGFSSSGALGCIDASSATDQKIAKAESKKIAGICKKCGGPGKACAEDLAVAGLGTIAGDGVADDLDPQTEIGFGTECPGVVLPYPPQTDCGTLDDLASGTQSDVIDSSEELVRCLDCVLEFKVDCIDRATVPQHEALPAVCVVPPATPTPTPTPTPTVSATPTLTATPTITATSTPLPSCGNDVLEPPEECDLTQGPCPGQCAPLGLGGDSCTCPVGTFDLHAAAGADLDTGWTGISHDQEALAGFLFPADAYGCTSGGPDTRCGFVGRYQTPFFGPPLPLSAGGVAVCVVNEIAGDAIGHLDLATGELDYDYDLTSKVHTGIDTDQPCPLCVGDVVVDDDVKDGTCDGGPNDGGPCDADAVSAIFGDTSFDCFPDPVANIGNLPISFRNATTGTLTLETTAASPSCTAAGFTTQKCFCDTCDNVAATPCRTDADCVLVGATTCGGRRCLPPAVNEGTPCTAPSDCGGAPCGRKGFATQPNACLDTVCTQAPGDEGTCVAGPFDGRCQPAQPFQSCVASSECPVPGDTCIFGARDCFTDPVVRTGSSGLPSGVYAGQFCIPPTGAGVVNSSAGLPGLGALRLPFTISNVAVP